MMKKNKNTPNLLTFTGDMIVYIGNHPKSTKNLLKLVNLVRLQNIGSIKKNWLYFYILTIENGTIFCNSTKNMKYLE